MFLLFYMFQSTLNIFGFHLGWRGGSKINYYHGWGVPLPPFAKNFAKIIKLFWTPSLSSCSNLTDYQNPDIVSLSYRLYQNKHEIT